MQNNVMKPKVHRARHITSVGGEITDSLRERLGPVEQVEL